MTRALIVGPRDALERVVNTLYHLRLLHLVDHVPGEAGLDIGKPLPQAAEASETLVKLRSVANVLHIEEPKMFVPLEPLSEDIREKVLALELNISEEDATRKKVQALLQDLDRKIEELTPFAQLPLTFEDYRGYENIEVLAGKTPREIAGLEKAVPQFEFETFSVPGFLVVFVAKTSAVAMRDVLGQVGFTGVPIPEAQGNPREALAECLAEKEKWEKRLSEIDERLRTLRERYATFLVSAKVHLEVEVEKAEAPLRFAVTDHTFIVEGWVPSETFATMKAELEKIPTVFVSELEVEVEHEEGAAEPPTLQKHARPLRPFEMLVKMYGAPSYTEFDPTPVLFLAFPMMFGIMVGDAGYGAVWLGYGLWLLLRRWKTRPWDFWKNLLVAFIWGGFWATIFGLFVFGEAFGIPFHAPVGATSRAEMFNWSDNILLFNIPLYPILEKLHQVADFIVLALLASYIHLATGFVAGFFNELRHSKKHALAKVSWLLILTGIFTIIMARAARWPAVAGRPTFGYLIWTDLWGWYPKAGFTNLAGFDLTSIGFTAANPIPTVSLALLGVGIVILLATEGGLHIMEVFSLVANTVSYARLAGIGVAEEAVIFALNVIALQFMIFPWIDTGNVIGLIAGIVVMFFANLMLFILSTISGAIQSIRLHYVEFFLKFYKGAGTVFRAFGTKLQPEV